MYRHRMILMSPSGRPVEYYCINTPHGIEIRKWRMSRRDKKFWKRRQTRVLFDETLTYTYHCADCYVVVPKRSSRLIHKGRKP